MQPEMPHVTQKLSYLLLCSNGHFVRAFFVLFWFPCEQYFVYNTMWWTLRTMCPCVRPNFILVASFEHVRTMFGSFPVGRVLVVLDRKQYPIHTVWQWMGVDSN